ncbi:MAG: F0F1 ATP synthase subunit B [Patescibacteria group bacterium]|nr:F0F1 ATP synthase subunit B [Patescibacteria group bacterium]
MVVEAKQVAESAGILGPLGVDVKLFLAQLVNFGVVMFVMWRWVYRPLLKVMDERTGKIETGLKQAEEAAALRAGAETDKEKVIMEARLRAKEIMEEAERLATEERAASVAKAKTEVERLVSQGKSQLAEEKTRIVQEARAETAELVALAVEKIAGEKLDMRKDEAIIRAALTQAGGRQ